MVALATETFTTPGTSVRVAATNGTLDISCWGAGEHGVQDAGAGGNGGAVAKKLSYSVTSGTSFDVIVGAPGSPGADSTFRLTVGGTVIARAKGGSSGSSNVGDTTYSGGVGGTYGGGSSAGTGGNGNNASGNSGGSAPTGGSNGGEGDDSGNGLAAPGGSPGGGGGVNLFSGGDTSGGNGKIQLTWTPSGGGGSNILRQLTQHRYS